MKLTKKAMSYACAGLMSLALGVPAMAQEAEAPAKAKEEKKAKAPRVKRAAVKGAVKSVDAEAKTITITTADGQEKTLTVTGKTMIALRGPLLNGVQAGDAVLAISRPGKEGGETLMKLIVSREGVSPAGKVKKPKKVKKLKKVKEPKKEKDGAEAPVE
jgi:Cu/Ag efflux protein CusF